MEWLKEKRKRKRAYFVFQLFAGRSWAGVNQPCSIQVSRVLVIYTRKDLYLLTLDHPCKECFIWKCSISKNVEISLIKMCLIATKTEIKKRWKCLCTCVPIKGRKIMLCT